MLSEVFHQLRDAVIIYDLDGAVAGHNERLLAMYGIGADDARIFDVREGGAGAAHPLDPIPRFWSELRQGVHKTLECRPYHRRDGAALHVECFARKTTIGPDEVILVDLHDLDRQRQAEEALRESKRQLERTILVRTKDLQEKIRLIEEQQDALLALSIPVIEVWAGVLVLPLIGTIDSRRSQQIMESVLSHIVKSAAREVIIDITGVPEVNEEVSTYLMRTVRAAGLLGTRCSLVGMAPRVAISLSGLEIDWSALHTCANLQAGLQRAIARLARD